MSLVKTHPRVSRALSRMTRARLSLVVLRRSFARGAVLKLRETCHFSTAASEDSSQAGLCFRSIDAALGHHVRLTHAGGRRILECSGILGRWRLLPPRAGTDAMNAVSEPSGKEFRTRGRRLGQRPRAPIDCGGTRTPIARPPRSKRLSSYHRSSSVLPSDRPEVGATFRVLLPAASGTAVGNERLQRNAAESGHTAFGRPAGATFDRALVGRPAVVVTHYP